MDIKELQKLLLKYLTNEGLKGEPRENGDISFIYNNNTYLIIIGIIENLKYINTILSFPWEIKTDESYMKCLTVMNEINCNSTIEKILFDDNKICIGVGLLLVDVGDFKVIFPKVMGTLVEAADTFINMRESEKS
jgi:hypothetical protein